MPLDLLMPLNFQFKCASFLLLRWKIEGIFSACPDNREDSYHAHTVMR